MIKKKMVKKKMVKKKMVKKKKPVQPSDNNQTKLISTSVISPDGTRVAMVVTRVDFEKDTNVTNIQVSTIHGKSHREFTIPGRSHSPLWSPDGQSLAYLSRVDKLPQLFIAPLDGGEPKQVTRDEPGVGDFCLSPDSRQVALVRRVAAEKKKTPIQKNAPTVITDKFFKFDGVGLLSKTRQHIFLLNLENESENEKEKQITRGG